MCRTAGHFSGWQRAAHTLLLGLGALQEDDEPELQKLGQDEDVEVRFFAQEAVGGVPFRLLPSASSLVHRVACGFRGQDGDSGHKAAELPDRLGPSVSCMLGPVPCLGLGRNMIPTGFFFLDFNRSLKF